MHAPYKAEEIAKFIVSHCWNDGSYRPVSHLAVQKILYFIQRDHLQQCGTPLIKDDFEAWQFGPVIPAVYRQFAIFAARPIRRTYEVMLAQEDKDFILERVTKYRDKRPWELVDETHRTGSAWDRTWKDGAGSHHAISQELIRIYG